MSNPARSRGRLPRRLLLVVAAVVGCLGVAALPATAHEPSATLVTVDRDDAQVVLEVRAPLDRYDFAYGTSLADDPAAGVAGAAAELTQQLQDDVTVSSGSATWTTSVTDLGTAEVNGVPNLSARLVATPGETDAARAGPVQLDWRFVTDALYSHKVYVVLAEDADAVLRSDTVAADSILGLVTTQDPRVTIDDTTPSDASTFTSLFAVGFDHFREGPDHLLFLGLLALGAARRRDGWSATAGRLALLTMAFTVGHSVSLAATTVGWISLPGPLVESGIALTILVTALHALRPTLTTRSELLATVAFGLVHGCGFAGTLSDLSIRGTDAVVPLLGFNLGLEVAQALGLVLIAIPLTVLARSTAATAAVAGAVGLVAAGWIVERAAGLPDPLAPVVDVLAGSPERLAVVLGLAACVVLARERQRHGQTAARHADSVPSGPG